MASNYKIDKKVVSYNNNTKYQMCSVHTLKFTGIMNCIVALMKIWHNSVVNCFVGVQMMPSGLKTLFKNLLRMVIQMLLFLQLMTNLGDFHCDQAAIHVYIW